MNRKRKKKRNMYNIVRLHNPKSGYCLCESLPPNPSIRCRDYECEGPVSLSNLTLGVFSFIVHTY